LLDEHPSAVVLPAHDGSIAALRARRAEVEERTAVPLASEDALHIAVNKDKTLAIGAELGLQVPESLAVSDVVELPDALKTVGLPAVVKPVESWAVRHDGQGVRLTSSLVGTTQEAQRALDAVLSAGGSATIQPWYPGRREAVTVFYANSHFYARFAQMSYREWPVLGGVSILCESIPLLGDIAAGAERLVEAIGLEGCSMVEFRRDREGRPVLMEVNPRMGGTVALPALAGVDFPDFIYRWATGRPMHVVDGYRVGQRVRWLVGDMWYLKRVFGKEPTPELPRRGEALALLVSDFVRRPSHLEGVSFSDPIPGLVELGANVTQYALPSLARWLHSPTAG
jgi:predicted ATP-grasp superfamily ATP-dependent carboligase